MATKIRLQRHGKKGKPFYHIVVTDSRARRDGKYIERVGFYNPTTIPASIDLDVDRALFWVQTGAEPTETVNAILKYKGVMYKKHLMRGVAKGAFSEEAAEKMFADWLEHKQGKIDHKRTKHKEEKAANAKAIMDAGRDAAIAKKAAKAAALAAASAEAVEGEEAEAEETEEVVTAQVEESAPEVTEEAAEETVVETAEEIAQEEVAAETETQEEAVVEVTEEAAEEAPEEVVAQAEETPETQEEAVAEKAAEEEEQEVVAQAEEATETQEEATEETEEEQPKGE